MHWNPQKLSICVIEDDPDVRNTVKHMLTQLNVGQIHTTADGREALKLIDAAPDMVDVVICDWNMPHMTGVEVLRQIRSAGSDVPFVMITGRMDKISVMEAKESGVSAYIAKPFTATLLEAKLRAVLASRKAT